MPDYAEMYRVLFDAQTRAIEILQKAQQETEEMYINSKEPNIALFPSKKQWDSKKDER
ncbi:MAG: hypothetical protein GX096_11460 [Clostridiales bacterium]|nr:hypothetical protein [Clostridiales bacterium]